MKGLLALASAHKAVTAVAVAAVVAGGGVVHAATDSTTMATVAKVVDGDTIDVRYDGGTHRVRLLNVNTPESVNPNNPVECLGPEASDWLEQRLPVGTEVRLERDQERRDRYDRELAAVFIGDELVNAEIARAGLGVAMSVGANTKYLSPVEAAQAEAEMAGRGLFSTSVECTVPAQAEQLQAAATEAIAEAPAATAALSKFDGHAAELLAVLAAVKALRAILDGDSGVFPLVPYDGQLSDLRYQVTKVENRLNSATTSNQTARAARKEKLEAEAQRAAEEAAQRAAEEAARLAQEAARAAAAAAAQAAEKSSSASGGSSSRTSTSSPSRTQAPKPPSTGSGSGSSGYTGCRSYAPGGKTYTPIPC